LSRASVRIEAGRRSIAAGGKTGVRTPARKAASTSARNAGRRSRVIATMMNTTQIPRVTKGQELLVPLVARKEGRGMLG
jgi:hypothetical protein